MTSARRTSRARPLILLTNDDGFFAEGIIRLREALEDLGSVSVVAPDREKSACSLSLTLHRPLRVKKHRPGAYAVDGTPADCVYLAVQKLLRKRPDLLISGINRGANLGRQDISYSGTVAGAIQGTYLGIRSVAVSALSDGKGRFAFREAALIARKLAEFLLKGATPVEWTLNVNFPPLPVKGARITTLGEKRYNPEIVEKKDPRLNSYFWIGTGHPRRLGGPGTDIRAVEEGFVSITPLHLDVTDYRAAASPPLKRLASGLFSGDEETRRRSGRRKSG